MFLFAATLPFNLVLLNFFGSTGVARPFFWGVEGEAIGYSPSKRKSFDYLFQKKKEKKKYNNLTRTYFDKTKISKQN